MFGEVGIHLKSKRVKFKVGVKWVMNLLLLCSQFSWQDLSHEDDGILWTWWKWWAKRGKIGGVNKMGHDNLHHHHHHHVHNFLHKIFHMKMMKIDENDEQKEVKLEVWLKWVMIIFFFMIVIMIVLFTIFFTRSVTWRWWALMTTMMRLVLTRRGGAWGRKEGREGGISGLIPPKCAHPSLQYSYSPSTAVSWRGEERRKLHRCWRAIVCAEQFAAAIREHQVLVENSGWLAFGVPRLSSFRAGKPTSQQGKQKGGVCCVGQREIGTPAYMHNTRNKKRAERQSEREHKSNSIGAWQP